MLKWTGLCALLCPWYNPASWSVFAVENFQWIIPEIISEEVPSSSSPPLTSLRCQLWWQISPDVSPGSATYRLSGPWANSVSFLSLHSLICKMPSASEDCNTHQYLSLKHLALSRLPINVSDYYIYSHPLRELEVLHNEKHIGDKNKRINIL